MNNISSGQGLIDLVTTTNPNLTQLRAIAKDHGKNQETAAYLWQHGGSSSKLLSLLMLELKLIDEQYLDRLLADIEKADEQDQRKLCDWLTANVIMKKNALRHEAENWLSTQSIIKQRIFWSVQAKTIKAENHALNLQLIEALEKSMAAAAEMVQENMNWCAAQIGIADERLRARCIQLGKKLALYIDYPVPRGCISPYLPIWIESVVAQN